MLILSHMTFENASCFTLRGGLLTEIVCSIKNKEGFLIYSLKGKSWNVLQEFILKSQNHKIIKKYLTLHYYKNLIGLFLRAWFRILNAPELSTLLSPSELLQGITVCMKYKHFRLFSSNHRAVQTKPGFKVWYIPEACDQNLKHPLFWSAYILKACILCGIVHHPRWFGYRSVRAVRVSGGVSICPPPRAGCNCDAAREEENTSHFKLMQLLFPLFMRQSMLHIRMRQWGRRLSSPRPSPFLFSSFLLLAVHSCLGKNCSTLTVS